MGSRTGRVGLYTDLKKPYHNVKAIGITLLGDKGVIGYRTASHQSHKVIDITDQSQGEFFCVRMHLEDGKSMELEFSAPLMKAFSEVVLKQSEPIQSAHDERLNAERERQKRKLRIVEMKKHLNELLLQATSSGYAVMVGNRDPPEVRIIDGRGDKKALRMTNLPVDQVDVFCEECQEIIALKQRSSKSLSVFGKHLFHTIRLAPECEAVYGSGPRWGKRCGAITTQFVERQSGTGPQRQYYCGRHIRAER